MKGGKQPLGYTIVEVMIVLAVSGVMFIIAANFVSGKQAKIAFNQGVNTMASNIQSTIEDAVDGRYSDIPINCAVNGAGSRYLSFSTAGGGQGSRQSCVYLGKLYHFVVNRPGTPDNRNNYEIFDLAGAKLSPSNGPLTLLSQSALTTITPQTGTAVTDFTFSGVIPQNLLVTGMKVDGTSGIYDFGFVQGFGLTTSAPGSYSSGSQTVSMIANKNVGADLTTFSVATVNSGNGAHVNEATVTTVQTVIICITDGTRTANITIGDSGSQLKAIPVFGSVKTC